MFGRGYIFVLVLIAAFFAPYLYSKVQDPQSPIAALWNKVNGSHSAPYDQYGFPNPNAYSTNGYLQNNSYSGNNNPNWLPTLRPSNANDLRGNNGYPNNFAPTPFSPMPPDPNGYEGYPPNNYAARYPQARNRQPEVPPQPFYPPGVTPDGGAGRLNMRSNGPPNDGYADQVTTNQSARPPQATTSPVPSQGSTPNASRNRNPTPHPANAVPDENGWVTVRTIPGQIVSGGNGTLPSATSSPSTPQAQNYPTSQPLSAQAGYPQGYASSGNGSNNAAYHPQQSNQQSSPQDANARNSNAYPQQLPKQTGPPPSVAAQLFRFDLQPDDISQQWDRVSTLNEDQLSGMRVALVSGTSESDLAGSLTYYFDDQNQLRRIAFQGTTGNPTDLIQVMTSEYGMLAEPTLGGGTYVTRQRANPEQIVSALRMRRAPVMRDDQSLHKYIVSCEVNPPQGLLSPSFSNVLDGDMRSHRWNPRGRRPSPSLTGANNYRQPAGQARPPDPRSRPPDLRQSGPSPRATLSPIPIPGQSSG